MEASVLQRRGSSTWEGAREMKLPGRPGRGVSHGGRPALRKRGPRGLLTCRVTQVSSRGAETQTSAFPRRLWVLKPRPVLSPTSVFWPVYEHVFLSRRSSFCRLTQPPILPSSCSSGPQPAPYPRSPSIHSYIRLPFDRACLSLVPSSRPPSQPVSCLRFARPVAFRT